MYSIGRLASRNQPLSSALPQSGVHHEHRGHVRDRVRGHRPVGQHTRARRRYHILGSARLGAHGMSPAK